jgi:hypothetical protein
MTASKVVGGLLLPRRGCRINTGRWLFVVANSNDSLGPGSNQSGQAVEGRETALQDLGQELRTHDWRFLQSHTFVRQPRVDCDTPRGRTVIRVDLHRADAELWANGNP